MKIVYIALVCVFFQLTSYNIITLHMLYNKEMKELNMYRGGERAVYVYIWFTSLPSIFNLPSSFQLLLLCAHLTIYDFIAEHKKHR